MVVVEAVPAAGEAVRVAEDVPASLRELAALAAWNTSTCVWWSATGLTIPSNKSTVELRA